MLLLSNCSAIEEGVSMRLRAIDLCVGEYTRLSGRVLDPEVDRAYVLAGVGQLDVLLTRGEVGTFGKRSESYRAYLSCGVLSSDSIKIIFLGEPLQDPLIDVP